MREVTQARISPEIKARMSIYAAVQGITLRELIDQVCIEWLSGQPPTITVQPEKLLLCDGSARELRN